MNSRIIARRRDTDQAEQPLSQHLQEAACFCASRAKKIGAEEAGLLLGLLHDFGKYSQEFQDYLTGNAVLCTATQPVLHELRCPDKGQLALAENHRLIDPALTAPLLNRVRIRNQVRRQGWTAGELAELALQQLADKGNCLVVVNTAAGAVSQGR